MGQTISLDELADRLSSASRERLRQAVQKAIQSATVELRDATAANIRARLRERSRSLLTSLRMTFEGQGDDIVGAVLVGGDYGGLHVPYARLQEYGGHQRPVNANYLTIPTADAQTAAGTPRYASIRQAPNIAFRPVYGRPKLRYLAFDTRTKKVMYFLVTDSVIPAKRFLRDALDQVARTLPDRLARAAAGEVLAGA